MPVGGLAPATAARVQKLTSRRFRRLWTSSRKKNPELADRILKARCRTDRVLFARYFFHEKLADPGTGKPIPFSRAHLAVLRSPKQAYRERPPGSGWRRAWELPRGNGKTTICLRIERTHDIVYEFEPYVVIMAESAGLARARVREIATELEQNKRLRRFFGDLVGEDLWRKGTGEIDTANGVSVRAKSMESQVRGLLHEVTNARPSLIALDDAEDSRDVLNPELRERDRRRFHEDIEGAAAIDGRTNFQATGTPLHREALLPGLKLNPAWEFREFPAILKWPARIDLWERCRSLWAAAGAPAEDDEGNAARATSRAIAWRFYQANRREMDRGAEVLWPEGESLFALMVWRWANGEAAFSKEKLLVPRDPTLSTFDVDRIVRHRIDGDWLIVAERGGTERKVRLSKLRFVAFHDPAKADPSAKSSTRRSRLLGDFGAIVVIGIEESTGGGRFGHVVDAWIERKPVTAQIEAAFALGERWRYELIVEDDVFALLSADYKRTRRERQQKHLFWQLSIKSLERQTVNKGARISSLEPAYTNGWLTWNVGLPMEYVNQHRDHPTGDHDDGPDATEGAWRAATRKGAHLALVNLE